MFSLVIIIISVALGAALALATLYYGGNSFNPASAKANAAQLINQSQQLLGAADLFKAENGRWPDPSHVLGTGYSGGTKGFVSN